MTLEEIVAAYEAKGLNVSVVRAIGSGWPVWVDFDPQAEEPTDREKDSVVRFNSERELRDDIRNQLGHEILGPSRPPSEEVARARRSLGL